MSTLVVLCAAVLALTLWLKFGTSLPQRYRSRNCEGRCWRSEFPSATKQEIRDFLLLFVSSFAFKDNEKLKFSPHDRIWGIYRELYPHRWTADALELETLTEDLLAKYDFSLAAIWSENLTLGEVLLASQRHGPSCFRPSADLCHCRYSLFSPISEHDATWPRKQLCLAD